MSDKSGLKDFDKEWNELSESIRFAAWYSGMEISKVKKAYLRWLDESRPQPESDLPVFESEGTKKGWFYAYQDAKGYNHHSMVFPTKEIATKEYLATVQPEAQPEPNKEAVSRLTEEMDKKNIKVSFGLQDEHMEIIKRHISVFEGAEFSEHIWKNIGKEMGWHPFTAALYYFREVSNLQTKGEAK